MPECYLPAIISKWQLWNLRPSAYASSMAKGEAASDGDDGQRPVDYDDFVDAAKQPIAKTQPAAIPSSEPSADKRWEVKGAVAGAAITAVVGGIVAIVVALINHSPAQKAEAPPPSTAIRVTNPAGSVTKIDIGGQEITITGTAGPKVSDVFIIIPRATGQGYYAAHATVIGGEWKATVAVDRGFRPSPSQVQVMFKALDGSNVGQLSL